MKPPPVHPELSDDVYAILLDIAKQPRSILFTVEPKKASRELLEPSDMVRPTATFLTSAERHLVSAHGDELDRWLWNLVNVQLAEHPSLAPFVHRHRDRTTEFELPSVAICREHLELLQPARTALPPFVSRSQGDPARELERIRELIVIATRFRRRTKRALHAGLSELALGRFQAATVQFTRLRAQGGIFERIAEEWLGACASFQGKWEDARQHHRRGASGDWGTLESALYWGAFAVLDGSPSDLAAAASWANELASAGATVPPHVAAALSHLSESCRAALRGAAAASTVRSTVLGEVLRAIS
jgi:hypothetical protein